MQIVQNELEEINQIFKNLNELKQLNKDNPEMDNVLKEIINLKPELEKLLKEVIQRNK